MNVAAPTSLRAVLDVLAADPTTTIVSGGTDLMVQVNSGRRRVERLVSLRSVEEIRGWNQPGPGAVRIGAACPYSALVQPDFAALVPGLALAARTVGSPQIRNAGTIGGNLATASPAGDTLPVLLALDAVLELATATATREVALADFLVGPKQTVLRPGELIVAVTVPALRGPQEFLKVGTRNAMVISVASVALVVDLDTRSARIGLGTVGPTVLRAPSAEEWIGANVDWDRGRIVGAVAEFVDLVRQDARPIDDHRSTAQYRTHVVGVCARRALERVFP